MNRRQLLLSAAAAAVKLAQRYARADETYTVGLA